MIPEPRATFNLKPHLSMLMPVGIERGMNTRGQIAARYPTCSTLTPYISVSWGSAMPAKFNHISCEANATKVYVASTTHLYLSAFKPSMHNHARDIKMKAC